ncbi:hypothetical protein MPPM_1028 [Methylorubrum populi]|uniref:Serine protease n=2 Tax=Methylorubrum populi TaxID=223967 RepID=A0A160PCD8_9HYPH|nr:hypothetical protein MPPM_1028 [Methylorubrum populi]
MIEKSLVYIHAAHGAQGFKGCGVLVEGPYVATCRHVWRMATESRGGSAVDAVTIEYPHAYRQNERFRTTARLADACEAEDGPPQDIVLLAVDEIPAGILPLQLAFDARYEIGEAVAVAGLTGRVPGSPGAVEDVTIEGDLADIIRADDRRQFTGKNPAGFWLERGSSGSPVFLRPGQHVAGILSLSELGVNSGQSHLHEAFVVRGQVIRRYVVRSIARAVARDEQVAVTDLREILSTIGAQDVPVAEIPERLRQFVEASRAHAAEATPSSNLGNDIDAAIDASRTLVGQFKPEEALLLLKERIQAEAEAFAQRTLPLLKEQVAVQRIALDHDGARASLERITQLDPTDLWAWIALGDVWMIAGDTAQAATAYRSAQAAATARGDERDLSVSHERIGDVLVAQGDGPGALAAYRASLAIDETLAVRDPANTQWQRDLSVSHNKIGDVLVAQGDGPGGLAAYRAALAIRETLAARDPANTQWQRDLSVSHNRIGDVLVAQGDGPGGLTAYRAALAIAETLAARDPANTQWQRDLSVSHERIGDVLVAQGDGPGGLAAYRAALAIAETLAARDPANTEWQRDLSISHERIGEVLVAQGDGPGGLAAYRAALAIRETLAVRDPANTEWQRDLSVSHNKIGEVLVAQGDGPAGLAAYRAGLTIAKTLAARDPANTEWQRDLSVSHNKIGDVLVAQGDGPGGLAAYQAALAIRETLAVRDPANTQWQRDLIVSYVKLAQAAPENARAYLERAASIAHRLHDEGRLKPVDHWIIDDLAAHLAALRGPV